MNLVLIGFMGTGKTAVGRALAALTGFSFVDADNEIGNDAGMSIPQIFATYGEEHFRQLEARAARRLARQDRMVIATGGGFVLNPANMDVLRREGAFVIALTAPPEVIWERVRHDRNRPLLEVADPPARIRELLSTRATYYQNADMTVDTSALHPDQIAAAILIELKSRGVIRDGRD